MTPRFNSTYAGHSGCTHVFEWFDADSIDGIPREQIKKPYTVAFHSDVTEVIICTKANYKQYFDWGEDIRRILCYHILLNHPLKLSLC